MKIDPYLSPKMLIIVSVGKEQAENSKIWWGWVKEGEKMNKKKMHLFRKPSLPDFEFFVVSGLIFSYFLTQN